MKKIVLTTTALMIAAPAFAGGHIEGRLNAYGKVAETPAGEKFGAIQATRIVGDSARSW